MMDALNVDWCLTCSKQTLHGKPYCSKACKLRAADIDAEELSSTSDDASSSSDVLREGSSHLHTHQPRTSSHRHTHSPSSHRLQYEQRVAPRRHHTHHHAPQQPFLDAEVAALAQWPGYNDAGIRAWASAIPAGCTSVDAPGVGPTLSSSYARPEFRLSRQRPAGPALCTDTTQPARTSLRSSSPISLPSPRADAQDHPSYSFSTYSLVSALTESIATPDSSRPRPARPRTQVRADLGNANKSGVLDGLTRRIRAWGTVNGAPALKHDTPAEIFMQTTTTTVPASPSPSPTTSSPSSPVQRPSTAKANSKGSASAFTVRPNGEDDVNATEEQRPRAVFDLRVPLANVRSPLAIGDSELKESLMGARRVAEQPKRGVWIAGREKVEKGWAGFGPAHYEKNFRACVPMSVDERSDREFREFEAWRARGRKTVRR